MSVPNFAPVLRFDSLAVCTSELLWSRRSEGRKTIWGRDVLGDLMQAMEAQRDAAEQLVRFDGVYQKVFYGIVCLAVQKAYS